MLKRCSYCYRFFSFDLLRITFVALIVMDLFLFEVLKITLYFYKITFYFFGIFLKRCLSAFGFFFDTLHYCSFLLFFVRRRSKEEEANCCEGEALRR